MVNPVVSLTQCSDYSRSKISEALERQFELLGGLGRFVQRGQRVLIKPNLILPKSCRRAVQTDPMVILETARLLKDFGAKPFVGDSPAWGNVFSCIKALGLEEPLSRLGVPVKDLGQPKRCRVGARNSKVGISSVALDADVIINLPKFKTHQQLVATFAVKNMFGCVSGKQKAYWHFARGGEADDFCRFLIEIFQFLKPALTIIDGVMAMDGQGPISGRARPLGWIIGGTEAIACEAVCCKLIDIDAEELPIIKAARQMDLGLFDFEKIEIVGDDLLGGVCHDFVAADGLAIKFSLLHVCKSVCKQMWLGIKHGKNKAP